MEAYGQFAWKLRHYRAGPPASNHSSNGPVCRHLGGRLSKEDPLLLPFSLRPLIAALLFSFPLSLSLSPSFSLSLSLSLALLLSTPLSWSHDSDSRRSLSRTRRRIFRLRATSINGGSARFYRWDRAGLLDPDEPLSRPTAYSLAFDRYFRSFRNSSLFSLIVKIAFWRSNRISSQRGNFGSSFFFDSDRRKGREDRFGTRFVVSHGNMESLETCSDSNCFDERVGRISAVTIALEF